MRESSLLQKLESESCIALRYVNDDGQPTMEYPQNPNGSAGNNDCRHLILEDNNFISQDTEMCILFWLRCSSRSMLSRRSSLGYDASP